jgi:Spy/CpxP family protein refolding chaperone
MLDRLTESLELTDDQLTQLTEVMTKGDKTAKTLQEKAVKATKALRTALLAADFDVVKVKELSTAAQKAEADLITASIDEWVKIRAILSDTQLTAMQKAMTPPARGGRGQGGPRGEGGPPPEGEGGPPPSDEF